MAGSSNFLQWDPGQSNMDTDSDYNAEAQRINGGIDGQPFLAKLGNKLFYQVTSFVAALAQSLAEKGYTISDANFPALVTALGNVVTFEDLGVAIQSVPFSPSPVFNTSGVNGFQMTLSGNVTSMTISNVSAGQLIGFYFVQDAIGGRTVAWPGNVIGGLQPNGVANAISIQLFRADLTGDLLAVSPMISGNTTIVNQLAAISAVVGQFTLSSPGTPGQVLTNVAGQFVPADLPSVTMNQNDGSGYALGSWKQNTYGAPILVQGYCKTHGSSVGYLSCNNSPDGGGTVYVVYENEKTATVEGASAAFFFAVPKDWWYRINTGGAVYQLVRLYELPLNG